MAQIINHSFDTIPKSYLFSEVARRVAAFRAAHPEKRLVPMGIGDVTRPLRRPCGGSCFLCFLHNHTILRLVVNGLREILPRRSALCAWGWCAGRGGFGCTRAVHPHTRGAGDTRSKARSAHARFIPTRVGPISHSRFSG